MKTATLPSVRIEPALRERIDQVLNEGETVSAFVESAVRRAVQRRVDDAEFHARADAALEHYRRTGIAYDAREVLAHLQKKLDDTRSRVAAKSK